MSEERQAQAEAALRIVRNALEGARDQHGRHGDVIRYAESQIKFLPEDHPMRISETALIRAHHVLRTAEEHVTAALEGAEEKLLDITHPDRPRFTRKRPETS